MSKITVVNLCPFPVTLPTGTHLAPGNLAEAEKSEVEYDITTGRLGLVEVPPAPKTITPAPPPRPNKESQETD